MLLVFYFYNAKWCLVMYSYMIESMINIWNIPWILKITFFLSVRLNYSFVVSAKGNHIIYIPVCWAFFCKHPRTKLPKLLEHLWTWSLRKYVNQHQCYLQSLLLQEYFSLLFICGSPQLMAHSGFSLVSGQIFVRTNLRPLKFFEKFYNWGKSRLG